MRKIFRIHCLCFGLLFFNGSLFANENTNVTNIEETKLTEAKNIIETLGKEALDIIKTHNSDSKGMVIIIDKFWSLLDRYFIMNKVAQIILRAYWRSLQDDEKQNFTQSLMNMLAKKYAVQFSQFKQATFKVTKAAEKSKHQTLVYSRASIPGKEPIEILWTVISDSSKVIDVSVSSVSVATTLSQTILDSIKKDGIKNFLKDFYEKNKDIQKVTNDAS